VFNYNEIKYTTEWFKEAHNKYFLDHELAIKNERTLPLLEKSYLYTTSHGRVALNPVIFESGCGSILKDIDGNLFLDMGSGIYVTNLGHAHPKVSEAVARQAKLLMNCHDYMTPVKAAFLERLSEAIGRGFTNIHLYDNGTTAVEFGIRAIRAITGKHEIISCFSDHHGKSTGSAALGRISPVNGPTRLPGFYLVPRPDPYRPIWKKNDGTIDTDAYISFYELFIKESTTGNVAAFILEPIQGWGGTIIPPDDFFMKLAALCKSRNILLMTDEILTGSGRSGKWLCTDYWGVTPDITVLGKGLGNGFPMSALLIKAEYAQEMHKIAPSTTFGGNPMACAAGLATLEVIEEEQIMDQAVAIGDYLLAKIKELKDRHPIIGDVRGKGCLLGIEFVKDRQTKEPFYEASAEIYKECMKRKLIPGIPVIHLLRIAPQIINDKKMLDLGLLILDESIYVVEKRYGYCNS
jgi:4-aminobutyrate aminotransferase-like enzyme